MKELKLEFTRSGFRYKQLSRSKRIALYSKESITSGNITYEVIIIQRKKAGVYPNGAPSPDRELFPSIHKWGERGFSFNILSKAGLKYLLLKGRFG